MKFGIHEIREFCRTHEDERVRIVGRHLEEARSRSSKWCDHAAKCAPIPLAAPEVIGSTDGPWVLTCKDDTSPSVEPALHFKDYEAARAHFDAVRRQRRDAKFDLFPLRRLP